MLYESRCLDEAAEEEAEGVADEGDEALLPRSPAAEEAAAPPYL